MEAFTYSSARQNLAQLLDLAAKKGEVRITRRDGSNFVIRPESSRKRKSPLDIKGVGVKGLKMDDVLESIHDGRKLFGSI